MIDFDDVYHVGIVVPQMEEAMVELGRRFGVGWGEPRIVNVASVIPAGTAPSRPE